MRMAIVYCRISTWSEHSEYEENIIFDYIDTFNEVAVPRKQLEVVEILLEYGSSKKIGRKIFNQMIDYIKEWTYSELICYDESCIARNPKDIRTLNELLKEGYLQNIRIVSNDRLYNKKHLMP